ncbi:glycoside hydrolase family 32 protein [Lacticaseibacillus kribbianus]|uniref:glycoside hydrolase family 32 protein n=1 Tax=Lacticaseibacillus kribbianus TaxID=2926292 RepID=UPI001CD7FD7B|nr:glycoside hydrolase family 32 protein [Lacticaseibacillus kribbianus]
MSAMLTEANRFVAAAAAPNPQYRPALHFAAPVGWLNDPNGFVFFRGQYHLFYQANPFDSQWGTVYWGHAVSDDLLHWRDLPLALAPDQPYDVGGCFSGTAIVVGERLYVMYTGNLPGRQVQCLAYSDDGVTFTKVAQNPVIDTPQVPAGVSTQDFRDPKVFRRGDHYGVLIASATAAGRGVVLLYESPDLIHWTYRSRFFEADARQGRLFECPDFFTLDGHDVLLVSTLGTVQEPHRYLGHNAVMALVGHVDWDAGRFVAETESELDGGFDFYAPETAPDASGRRFLIGWAQLPGRSMPTHELGHGWASCLTVPRTLSVVAGHLRQAPAPALATARTPLEGTGTLPAGTATARVACPAGQPAWVAVTAEADRPFSLTLAFGPGEAVVLAYDPVGLLTLDRTAAGVPIVSADEPAANRRTVRVLPTAGALSLQVLIDRACLEVYFGAGQAAALTYYPHTFGPAAAVLSSPDLGGARLAVSRLQ